jgi:hypothetical protein
MSNAWLNHVRQFRKQNRHLSYKQLLSQAKKSYGGAPSDGAPVQNQSTGLGSVNSLLNSMKLKTGGADPVQNQSTGLGAVNSLLNSMKSKSGGSVTGFESRSSLTRSATTLGGRRSSRSRKTRRRRR